MRARRSAIESCASFIKRPPQKSYSIYSIDKANEKEETIVEYDEDEDELS